MALPHRLQIALKEWDSVCSALEGGRQIVLLRKGGIHESTGQFELENPQFLLFPTYLHQNAKSLKSTEHSRLVAMTAEPAQLELRAAASVTDIIQLQSRAQIDAIDSEHIWTTPLIDMRFNYRPENPLYLLLVRVYQLPRPITIANTLAYAGCKSWVPLTEPIDTANSIPVLGDAAYETRRSFIRQQTAEQAPSR
jgi:hypothetical protein